MKFGVLITNNHLGNHPADKWAEVTVRRVSELFDLDDDAATAEAQQARRDKRTFESKLIDSWTRHHQVVNDREVGQLAAKGDERLKDTMDSRDHVADVIDSAMADLLEAANINPRFVEYFGRPDIQQHIKDDMLAVDFSSSIHVCRYYHCDRRHDRPVVKAGRLGASEHGYGHAHHFMLAHLPAQN